MSDHPLKTRRQHSAGPDVESLPTPEILPIIDVEFTVLDQKPRTGHRLTDGDIYLIRRYLGLE